MKIKVSLDAMHFYASHGCYDTEQRVGGRFLVDISYIYDGGKVVENDDVCEAVNYLDIYALVRDEMAIPSHTIEHAANRIVQKMLEKFPPIENLTISLYKITPPLGGDIERVGVTLELSR